jgi:hypothetical protein
MRHYISTIAVICSVLFFSSISIFAQDSPSKGTLLPKDPDFKPKTIISDNVEGSIKWEETFNTTVQPPDWLVIDNDGSGSAYSFEQQLVFTSGDTVSPQAGQSFWFSNYTNANSSGLIDEWLISPQIPAIEAGDSLIFYAGAIGGSFPDSLKVLISTTDQSPGSFTEIAYFLVDGPTGAWNRYAFDLSPFAGSQIYAAVNYYIVDGGPSGNNSDNVWVDHFIVTTQSGGNTARVQVIHNSADVLAGEVDVYLDGALALNDFAFRTATPFIDLPAGTPINIGIAPGNSGSVNDTLKNFQVTLTPGETYVVFANGVLDPNQYAPNPDGRSTAFTLLVKPMARETGTGSDVDFFALHGSTDAPTVDIKAREAGNLTLVNDAAYTDITDYIQVPPADYTLDLYLADGTTLVASFIAPLSGLGGGAAAVFASGFLDPSGNQNGPAFGIFAALPDGTVIQLVPGVVPVELSSFTANVSGNSVRLNWITNTETNNRGFEIQRKTGNEFSTIAFVDGKGTTTEKQNYSFVDGNLARGTYTYRLKQVDFDGTSDLSNEVTVTVGPTDYSLNQNYPNPFNPSTIITFNLAVDSKVTLTVFNLLGEEVTKLVNGNLTAGTQQVNFDASKLNSGTYFYQLQATGVDGSSFTSVKKMMLTK